MNEQQRPLGLVVVVEDDPPIREALIMFIELQGYMVRAATNGDEAFALLKELKEPCLILTDLMMPGMNGYEFIELASKTHTIASIPIVVVSASPNELDLKVMSESGKIKGMVKKPVDLDYMLTVLQKHCGPSPSNK